MRRLLLSYGVMLVFVFLNSCGNEVFDSDGDDAVEPKFKFALDELVLGYGESALVEYGWEGVESCTFTAPEGWKAGLKGDKVEITAPSEDDDFAELEGKVTAVAVAPDGRSVTDEINVSVEVPVREGTDLNAGGEYANCYIVSEGGATYYFDARVMGNGKATDGLEAPSDIDPKDVLVLWETGSEEGGVIASVSIDKGIVSFTTGPEANGNAVIAVTDGVAVGGDRPRGKGTILWSWHIWATAPVNDVDCTSHSGVSYSIMDRNLGEWVQPEGSESSYQGLKYQWGRKDPFIGFTGTGEPVSGSMVYSDDDYRPCSGYMEATGTAIETLKEAIMFPEVFYNATYYTQNDWYGVSDSDRNDGLWGSSGNGTCHKTIYDPCPAGYMVAPYDVFTGFTSTGESVYDKESIVADGSWNEGWYFSNASSFFPASGSLTHNSGVLRLVPGPGGREGYYWSSDVSGENARMADFNQSYVLLNSNKRASGCSVRCVREKN